MNYSCVDVILWCNTSIIRFCFWIFHIIFLLWGNLKVKFFFIKLRITNILILLLWNFKNQLTLQFPCPLMTKVIMEILFAVLFQYCFCQNIHVVWKKVFYPRSALKATEMWLAWLNCWFYWYLEQAFENK